jgi:predicted CXXCH cytochrome family protein
MLKEFTKNYIHKPIEQGGCTGCHDPHAASESKFLVQPRDTLCDKCHDTKSSAHLHRVGAAARTTFAAGTPLSREGTTTCYTCHLFHSSNETTLKRGTKEQCGIGCHDVPQPEGAEGATEPVTGGTE